MELYLAQTGASKQVTQLMHRPNPYPLYLQIQAAVFCAALVEYLSTGKLLSISQTNDVFESVHRTSGHHLSFRNDILTNFLL